MKTRWGVVLLTVCTAVSACSNRAQEQADAERLRATNVAKTKARLAMPIKPQTMVVGQHQLLVVEVPSLMLGGPMLEVQRCYVWRDLEFKTSAMSCPGGEARLSVDSDVETQ